MASLAAAFTPAFTCAGVCRAGRRAPPRRRRPPPTATAATATATAAAAAASRRGCRPTLTSSWRGLRARSAASAASPAAAAAAARSLEGGREEACPSSGNDTDSTPPSLRARLVAVQAAAAPPGSRKRHYRRNLMFFQQGESAGAPADERTPALFPAMDILQRLGLVSTVGGARGLYALAPLLQRALDRLQRLVEVEMDALTGAQKLSMPCLTPSELWYQSGRFVRTASGPSQPPPGVLCTVGRQGREYVLGPTHEEAVTSLLGAPSVHPQSAFPLKLYQITPKFRDELRPRGALLRTIEFLMKDMYSFDVSESESVRAYEEVKGAYARIFDALALPWLVCSAASTGIGDGVSEEFHILHPHGEDRVFRCPACGFCANVEVLESTRCPKDNAPMDESRAIEIAHVFQLGTKYSAAFGATVGAGFGAQATALEMGCFGIGLSRLLAAALEAHRDAKGLRFPLPIAPFRCVVNPAPGNPDFLAASVELCDRLDAVPGLRGEVLVDDRCQSIALAFKLLDNLELGFPFQIVIGRRWRETGRFELIRRSDPETRCQCDYDELVAVLLGAGEPLP